MSFQAVNPGRDIPNDVNVIVEIPMNSPAVKYEVDKETGAIFVDRILKTAMHYPCNYGYIPHTLCGDGDPVDVLVVMPLPLVPGSVVRCRPVGVLKMEDESGDVCRFCFNGGDLVAPCACKGSTKYVHVSCLEQWQKSVLLTQSTHPKYQTQIDEFCNHGGLRWIRSIS